MEGPPLLLWPKPRHCESRGECLVLPSSPRIAVEGAGSSAAAERLQAELRGLGLEPRLATSGPELSLRLEPGAAPAQGYRLGVSASGVEIVAGDPAGLFYGVVTLGQWLRLNRRGSGAFEVAPLQVEDRPDFAVRGVLLDISRDKVPTLETALELVERLAGWKVNQLQLYMEHTFAYRGHEAVWRQASPWKPEEIRRLDEACRRRFIELVPNQNSFGHLHRWLRHEPYRRLAECPDGVKHPFGDEPEPFSLCPLDPGSLELLSDLYDQLLPQFSSRQLNVGCDETFDLGRCRSAAACEERGKGRVYLDFLRAVHRLAADRGRRMQFWGDVIVEHPELIPELPADAVALEWGYEAGHPFAEHGRRFAASGLDFYVCPGTSSWNSLAGRAANALANLAEAAVHGRANGAAGYLVTDWGDFGHLQPLPASHLGLLAGAGFGWNADAADPPAHDWPRLLDAHAFAAPGKGLGRAWFELAQVYRLPGPRPKNASSLFHLLLFAGETLEAPRFEALTAAGLEASRQAIAVAVAQAGGGGARADLELAVAELHWTAAALDFAARLGLARLAAGRERHLAELPAAERTALRKQLPELLEAHREIWLARNRPGGLADSQQRLARLDGWLR